MASIIVGNIIQMKFYCALGDQVSINVRHWRCTTITGFGATTGQMAGELSTTMSALYKPILATAATYLGASSQLVWPLPPQVADFSANGTGIGTSVGEPLPPQVAGLINFTTQIATRQGRGRAFLPYPAESDNAATGRPIAAYQANALTLAVALRSSVTVGVVGNQSTLVPVLWTRGTGNFIQVTGTAVRNAWSQVRRRSFIRRGDIFPPFP